MRNRADSLKIIKHVTIAALSSMLFPAFISDTSLDYSNSIFSVLMMLVCFFLLHHAEKEKMGRRLSVYAHGLGFLFSLMTAYGAALSKVGSIAYFDLALNASILLFAHLYAKALGLLWLYISRHEASLFCEYNQQLSEKCWVYRMLDAVYKTPVRLFLLLLLCWLPCYISTFPGNFVYDASYEYYQLSDGFTRSYPLLHSVIITRLLSFSEWLTGSVNPGIAVYTIVQMFAVAALFTHILRRFHKDAVHPVIMVLLTLYYAAFPVIHLLVTCTTRDVLFSVMVTWCVYLLYLIAQNPAYIFSSFKHTVLLAAVLVFMLLARNNNSGPLAMILLLGVCGMMFISFGRQYLKSILLLIVSALGLFYGVSAIFVLLCQPLYDSPPAASLSILAQPIVRTYMYHGDTWPEEDQEEFESYFNMETLEYFPQNADPAKGNLTVRYANMKKFLAFWIKIGLRYPTCYLDAVLASTKQMWYPASVLDGYTVRGMFSSYEKNYFYFGKYIEEIGSRMNWLPGVFRFYEKIGMLISFEKIPVVSMLFSIGFHVWMLLHGVFYVAYRKCYVLFWPLSLLLIYTICCAFVPLVLVRYFAALFLACPMVIVITLCPVMLKSRA